MTYLTDEMLLAFLDGIIADGGSVLAYQARATVKDLLVERAARQQPVATSQRTQPKANFDGNTTPWKNAMRAIIEEVADVRSAFATPPVQPAHDKGEGK